MQEDCMPRVRFIAGLGLAAILAVALLRPVAANQEPVKLTGCVERDAAANAPTYKLIVMVDNRPHVYVLDAPKEIDLRAVVGKTAAVTGVPRVERAAGRDVNVLGVRSLDIVSQGCGL
jgi:hypothetical protein